jgi:predicted Zn-dependent peptidase
LSKTFFNLHRHTLSNNMHIWCVPRPGTETVALLAQLPVGVRTEAPENNGISHFVEHMVFTGTARWNESDVTDVVRRRGGECNAQTSREETAYYVYVSREDLAFGIEWLDQVLFKPTLTEEKFEKERQVIINEKGGEIDALRRAWEWLEDRNLGWSVDRAARRRLFPDSAFLMPIIGTDHTLKNMTHTMLLDYYNTFYVPHNVTLLVVGDVEPQTIFEMAEQQFGTIPDRPSPSSIKPVAVDDTPFTVRLHGPTPNQQGQFLIGTMLGDSNDPRRFAWYIIGEMLENVYMQTLRYEQGLSYDVQVYPVLYSDVGYFKIYTSADIEHFATVRTTIEHHLQRLINGNFSASELQEAKAALRGRALLNLQDNLELAWWLSSDALVNTDDHTPMIDYFEGLAAVSAKDIQHIARTQFAPEKRFCVEHYPILTPQKLKPVATLSAMSLAGAAWLLKRNRRRIS